MATNIKIRTEGYSISNYDRNSNFEPYHKKLSKRHKMFEESESEYDEEQFANVDEDVIAFNSKEHMNQFK